MAKKAPSGAVPAGFTPSIPTLPDHAADRALKIWQWAVLFSLVFVLCDLLRLAPGSERLLPKFDGVPLMHNADSYAWLAAAKKINQFTGRLLPEILRLLNLATGIDIGVLGFYLPLVLAPLVIAPVFVLAAWWRLPEAAVPAGLMAGASFGFLSRTLVGWLDSDVLTLFFPVSLAVALLIWLERFCDATRSGAADGRRWTYCGALAIGLLFKSYLLFYPNGKVIGLSIVCFALFVGLAKAGKDRIPDLLLCLIIMLLASDGSWVGFGSIATATALIVIRPLLLADKRARIAALSLAVAALLVCYPFADLSSHWLKIMRYWKGAPVNDLLSLPSVTGTVEEAQATDLQTAIRSVAGNWPLLAAGVAGFVYCVRQRPAAIVFTPLLVLGLLCGKMGSRFGMYGGAVLGIGLAFGLALVLRSAGAKAATRWTCQLITAGVVFWTAKSLLLTTSLTDWRLTSDYASAFSELKGIAAPGAQIWTWWDWGYAAQYYSERMTFADGGRNSAAYVLPLARLHYTSSPLYAYQLMLFTAQQQKKGIRAATAGAIVPQYDNPFSGLMNKRETKQARDLMDGFGAKLDRNSGDSPEQYLVFTWDNLNHVPVIRDLGSWNPATGETLKGTFAGGGRLEVDLGNGVISHRGRRFELAAMDIVRRQNGQLEKQRKSWQGRKQEYFTVLNSADGSLYPMDEGSYHSIMVQMLIAEPESFEPYFTLVIDRSPHIRVYRLNQKPS